MIAATSASEVIRRLQPKLAPVDGITLYMQPVQDLRSKIASAARSTSTRLEDAGHDRAGCTGSPNLVESCDRLPELSDVASDQQNTACGHLVIDRDTASRLGITPQTIDDALYDAFGQRQVSTMFTQLNQYHVVLEVRRSSSRTRALNDIYVASAHG